jgi:acetyl esterase/lipase
LPAAAALLSPWTDLTCSGRSLETNQATDPVIDSQRTAKVARWYTGSMAPDHPLISPLLADLTGLPPLLILVGAEESLLDDSSRLAERAASHGVRVELDIKPGMVHVWPYYAEWIPEGQQALQQIDRFFRSIISHD